MVTKLAPKTSVAETIKKLKGSDCRVSSKEEADAILQYYNSLNKDALAKIDQERLVWAYRDAQDFLEYGDTSLLHYAGEAIKYIKNKGSALYARFINKNNNSNEGMAFNKN